MAGMSDNMIGRYVVVATSSRPWIVVAGELAAKDGGEVTIRRARMIVYYAMPTHGLVGVAVRGPGAGRVSPAVTDAVIRNVESVLAATPEAQAAIEAEPWN